MTNMPRKVIPTKTATTKESTKKPTAFIPQEVNKEIKPVQLRMKKRNIVVASLAILILALIYNFKGVFVAAIVNGQPITRLSLIQELEKQGGSQTLSSLITKTLILQEANKKGVKVSNQELNDEIKKIESNLSKQGLKLDEQLKLRKMSKNDLLEQVKIQKLLEKLVGKEITVSDKEVNDYIDQNKSSFPEGTKVEEIKTEVKNQLKQQKMNQKIQEYIDKLEKDAKINYWVNF